MTAPRFAITFGEMHLSVETVIVALVILNLIGLTIAAFIILRRK